MPVARGDQTPQGFGLGRVEVLVVGDDEGAFDAVEGADGTPGADPGQAVGGEVAQLVGRGGEQIGVVGGDERADEVEGTGLDGGEIGLVEKVGDVVELLE